MCFQLHKSQLEPKTATKAITCYKLLVVPNNYHCAHPLLLEQAREKKAFFSFVRDFEYVTGKSYSESLWGQEEPIYRQAKLRLYGFHSYGSLAMILHHRQGDWYDEVIVEFEIPVGSQYYYNPTTDEYISQEIRCIGHYPLWKAMFSVLLHPIRKVAALYSF